MNRSIFAVLCLALLSLGHWTPMAEGQSPFLVITNPNNPVTSLSRAQVSKFLFKKVSKWEHGPQVEAVDQGGSQAVREVFTKEIHGRSVTNIKRYWQRQIFTGAGVPPPELDSDGEVVEFVRRTPGAIGYVSADASLDGVKEVTITE